MTPLEPEIEPAASSHVQVNVGCDIRGWRALFVAPVLPRRFRRRSACSCPSGRKRAGQCAVASERRHSEVRSSDKLEEGGCGWPSANDRDKNAVMAKE